MERLPFCIGRRPEVIAVCLLRIFVCHPQGDREEGMMGDKIWTLNTTLCEIDFKSVTNLKHCGLPRSKIHGLTAMFDYHPVTCMACGIGL